MTGTTGRGRCPYLVAALCAAALFGATTLLVRRRQPSGWEVELFEAVNSWPDRLYGVLWPLQQFGSLASVPLAAAVAWWPLRRRRVSVLLLVSGSTSYLLAKVVKEVSDRGRPADYVSGVVEREHLSEGSLGYVSGHAAVAATLATLAAAHLPPPWPRISVGLTVTACLGRIYVGAHLPLDLVGGVALGVAVGAAASPLARARTRRADIADIERSR